MQKVAQRPLGNDGKTGRVMWRFIKVLIFLTILMALGFVAYAYIGPVLFPSDFAAPAQEVIRPVTLDAN